MNTVFFLKRNFNVFLFSLLIIVSGCSLFSNPLNAFKKVEKKVDNTQNQLQDNQNNIIKSAANYAYGANTTLSLDPNPNKYNLVAKGFTERTVSTLGVTPSMEDANNLRIIVTNLLSENAKLMMQGEKHLADYDAQVSILQQQKEKLENSLTTQQTKLNQIGEENSVLANKWAKIVKIFWWIIYGFIAMVLFRVLAAILPPPYNNIVSLVSLPFSLLVKLIHSLIPEAKEMGGLVGKEYRTATNNLVSAIQTIKSNNPDIHTEISDTVLKATDTEALKAINNAKTNVGLTS